MTETDIALYVKRFAIAAIPALMGIILHEVAHGWVAAKRGDPTASQLGRLTLNPLPHIDPTGLLVFGLTSLTGSFVFGWAKPVPVNPRYFRNPVRDMMLVALAGPMTNFILAAVFAVLLRGFLVALPPAQWASDSTYMFVLQVLQAGVFINCGLAWLNLLPLPPLDGSKVLAYFLPPNVAWQYMQAERYGFLILLVLLVTGGLGYVLGPLVRGTVDILVMIVGL